VALIIFIYILNNAMMLAHQHIRSNSSSNGQQQYPDVVTTTTDLCRMMNHCNMEKVLPVPNSISSNNRNDDSINCNTSSTTVVDGKQVQQPQVVKLDQMKASSWDRHDSMHTTSRTKNIIMDDEYRQWNNMDSIHSIKTLSWNTATSSNGIMECKPSMSFSSNEQEMHGSNSDYNDSICSFASFGDTSFSDNMDGHNSSSNHNTSFSSIQHASKTFTRSFDTTGNEDIGGKLIKQPSQQRLMIRGVSYRNGGNSLSKIQETSMD
jgi:hypothetical protein